MTSWEVDEVDAIATSSHLIEEVAPGHLNTLNKVRPNYRTDYRKKAHGSNIFEEIQKALWEERLKGIKERAASVAWWNSLQCRKKPVYGTNLRKIVTVKHPVLDIQEQKRNPSCYLNFSSNLADIVLSPIERFQKMVNLIESFMFAIPAARSPSPVCWCSKTGSPALPQSSFKEKCTEVFAPLLSPIRPAIVRRQVYFPDRRLIQFDCGKLQQLAVLLRRLKSEGHRALIFTQMTKMLDILEAFINLYGYTYMRLDGSTPPEERQTLMQRFNTNPKIFLFILSTRSGGVGINLVGPDTVIFYDSDWNPAMDQQAQDRCHRIGQTREVHIYRLISESTIEENILKKANQKRALDDLVIQSGGYNTEFFKKLDPIELFSGHSALPIDNLKKPAPVVENSNIDSEVLLSSADVEAALKHVEDEADYMALKKVEEEEAVDNQEFTEDAIGRLEEDEFVNEDDIKPEEKVADDKAGWIVSKEMNGTLGGTHPSEERSLTLVRREEDVDMLADVKQLAAAAAAAGQASSSFENQLRPIDRYAMRFLDLWDPIIDKSAIETQVAFEEEEWELDRIEKLKEDLEAEIDEDEEPLVYETWDADFATEAYRQEVEALAQRQLMEELEAEAKEAENADDGDEAVRNEAVVERKSKSKKKTKKTKFKSLKKGALASESEAYPEEPPIEVMYIDDKVISPDREASSPRIQKKRKKSAAVIEDEKISRKPSKKVKKPLEICPVTPVVGFNNLNRNNEVKDLKPGEIVVDLETKPACRSKIGGKISIMAMPIKRVLVIKPEKLKKKGSVWSKECVPPADPWSSQEDAILCAIVHEYGSHWNLVSDTLYGMTGGGFYRGRFRHPFHCCERFRELCYKYVVSTTENPNNEKINPAGSLKALIKVSEDHVRTLLDVASELPDNELLLQKHFTAIISSVWRAKYRFDRHQNISTCNDHYSSGRFLHSATCLAPGNFRIESEKINKASFAPHRKLVAAALNDACKKGREEPAIPSHPQESQHTVEKMEITLEFQDDQIESRSHLPWSVNLSISGSDIPEVVDEAPPHGSLLPELSCNIAEKRLRMASTACFEGEILGWASTTFPTSEIVRPRPGSKSQLLGKHKATPDSIKPPKSKLSRSAEPSEESSLPSKPVLPPPQNVSTDSFGSLDHLPSLPGTMEDNLLCLAMDNSIVEEGYELVSHCFDPNFIAGLDDCELTKQITDIG